MPRSQNPSDDRKLKLIDRKIQKEKKLNDEKQLEETEKVLLENIIENMSSLPENPKGPINSVLQDILRYRYLDAYPWEWIMKLIFSDDDDFIDKTESNLRKLHIWNGQALTKFRKCQGV